MKKKSLGTVVLLAVLVVGTQAQPVAHNGLLADAAGRTLYTFDKDTASKNNCSSGCLATWAVFAAKPSARPQGDSGLIDATGGQQQWTPGGGLRSVEHAKPSGSRYVQAMPLTLPTSRVTTEALHFKLRNS